MKTNVNDCLRGLDYYALQYFRDFCNDASMLVTITDMNFEAENPIRHLDQGALLHGFTKHEFRTSGRKHTCL